MDKRSRAAIGGAVGLMALFAGGFASFADSLDARLAGAWTTSQTDCSRLFVRRGGALAYRQPVDKFAQAAIIAPQVILLPSNTCRVHSVSHEKGVVKIGVDCNDSISYTAQTVQIKVNSSSEIVYSPTGDPALETTMIKCAM